MGQKIEKATQDEMDQIFRNINKTKEVSRADFQLVKLLSFKQGKRIYQVERISDGQKFAMKIIDKYHVFNEQKVDQILQELKIYTFLNHPFILKVHYAFQDDVYLYLVTDYCKGSDLGWQMKSHEIYTEKETSFLIACLILALGAIHKKNVVNLGLTLEHILIDEKGYPRISNFSQAIILDKNKINLQVLNNDLITEFVAPEILQRQQPGIEADFYSLGIIMAYLMSGKKNEEQQQLTRKQLINNILKKNFKNVQQSDLPEGWTDLAGDFVNKLTQKKAQNRLGYYGFEELQAHHWVDNIPWQKIEQRLLVDHYIPKIKKNESFTMFRMINNEISNNQSQAQEQVLPAQAKKLIRRISFQEVFEPYYYSAEQQSDDEDGMCQDDIRSLKSNSKQQQNQLHQQQQININLNNNNNNNGFDQQDEIESDQRSSVPFLY